VIPFAGKFSVRLVLCSFVECGELRASHFKTSNTQSMSIHNLGDYHGRAWLQWICPLAFGFAPIGIFIEIISLP